MHRILALWTLLNSTDFRERQLGDHRGIICRCSAWVLVETMNPIFVARCKLQRRGPRKRRMQAYELLRRSQRAARFWQWNFVSECRYSVFQDRTYRYFKEYSLHMFGHVPGKPAVEPTYMVVLCSLIGTQAALKPTSALLHIIHCAVSPQPGWLNPVHFHKNA